jgi:monolysocardiolipin acyltransferase
MESAVPPVIVPMWLTGFEKLMPEGRAFPYKYFPRPGAQLNVTFGDPLPVDEIKKALGVLGTDKQSRSSAPESGQQTMPGWMGDEVDAKLDGINLAELQKGKIRSEVTAIIQRGVESLGRSVSGEALAQKA